MNKRVLVIEDDPSALRLVQYALEKGGYQVLTATNGLAGLRKARSEEPDLIVLDVMLPGIDGFEICHRLRSEPETAQLPILMLSAKAQEIDRATGLKVGADDYITKPADTAEIVNRVRSLLDRKAAGRSGTVGFLGSKERVGTTTMVVNTAITLSQMGKRVSVVDFAGNGSSVAEHLGIKAEFTAAELLVKPLCSVRRQRPGVALAVHDTGVRVLTIPQFHERNTEVSLSDVDSYFDKLREVTDCFLLDLPYPSRDLEKVVIARCSFVIIVTDSKIDALPKVRSTASFLEKLGIGRERMGTVIIDRDTLLPEMDVSKLKPTIELQTGVDLLGIIPGDAKLHPGPGPASSPVVLSEPNGPVACSIREVVEHIVAQEKEHV